MTGRGEAEQLLIVKVPVANLRREPIDARKAYRHDDLQQTQLLFNETLIFREEVPGWYRVEAREQSQYTAGSGWRGYQGWVRKEHLSSISEIPIYNGIVKTRIAPLLREPDEAATPVFFFSLGTRLRLSEESGAHAARYYNVTFADGESAWIRKDDVMMPPRSLSTGVLRSSMVQTASLFIGVPYLWGGRSMFMADLTATVTGVDCSGLTNLIYRANDIDIPRDAHDQYLAARRAAGLVSENMTGGSPGAGDLIFVSRQNQPDLIDHVMLSTGGETFIEALETGSSTKERTFQEKFGVDLAGLEKLKFTIQGKRIYFGNTAHLAKALL